MLGFFWSLGFGIWSFLTLTTRTIVAHPGTAPLPTASLAMRLLPRWTCIVHQSQESLPTDRTSHRVSTVFRGKVPLANCLRLCPGVPRGGRAVPRWVPWSSIPHQSAHLRAFRDVAAITLDRHRARKGWDELCGGPDDPGR